MSGAETVRVLKDAINSRRVFSINNGKYNPINVSDIQLDEDDEVVIKLNNMETDVTEISIEIKNQEQTLLWTFYSILDNLAVEGEARDIAIKEFKEHLINKDL